ncbi:MAG: GNAT family N-acetyltransferase [Clostridiales bacterium]|nr:GNAT family N-acetyltransferase [Clostridiales bacterium]
MDIRYTNEISLAGYLKLRERVQWPALTKSQAIRSLENSSFRVGAWKDKELVGCGRVIDDHGYMAFIVDVMVDPACQGQGIGSHIVETALKYCKSLRKFTGDTVLVNLMSASGKEEFYRKFGFIERPNESMGAGMCMWID